VSLDICLFLSIFKLIEIKGEGYVPTYTRTDFTDDLHEIFGFRTDYQMVKMRQIKKFLKIQKNKKVLNFSKNTKSLNLPKFKKFKAFFLLNCQR